MFCITSCVLIHCNDCFQGCQFPSNPVYTIQPVVQPVWQPAVSCKQTFNRLSNWFVRLSNWFDNRLNVCIQDTARCQTSCQTGLTTVLNELFVQPVVKLCLSNRVCQTGLINTVWQTPFDNRVERTAVRSTRLSNRLYNRFDDRLYTWYSRFVKLVVKRV